MNFIKTFKQITTNKDEVLNQKLEHNFIHNRFDILFPNKYDLYEVGNYVIPVYLKQNKHFLDTLLLGNELCGIDNNILKDFYNFLFQQYPTAGQIKISHSISNQGLKKKRTYWYIDLPSTKEEFDKRLGQSTRYNTKRHPRKIIETFGEYTIEYLDKTQISNELVKLLLKWKKERKHYNFKGNEQEYIKHFHITEAYVMKLQNEIVAIIFNSDTGENVYFEQIAFSTEPKYQRYSLGNVLYYYTICDLIKRKKKRYYLYAGSGKKYEYKKRMNGKEIVCYNGYIRRKENPLKLLIRFLNKNKLYKNKN